MRLIAVYVGIVAVGILLAYAVGRVVEHWSESASLIVFLAAFFVVLYGSWRLATRLT